MSSDAPNGHPHTADAPTSETQQLSVNADSTQVSEPRRPSGASNGRVCAKCGGTLTGQFLRALEGTWHIDCFTCHDCGKIVASKFFPVPEQPPHEYPLCEIDYFRRLGLLCHQCGGALRSSYVTAIDRKYHIEHFTCSVCPTVFGEKDSYYEHEGSVYCHYHYSTRFAQRCNGCLSSILKQFVEIFRNGRHQHWHPECYMIHKYWNVRLHAPGQSVPERMSVDGSAPTSEGDRRMVRDQEQKIENKVLEIWRTLSHYEEKSASCISDMLLHVSNGAYVDGIMSAKKFIVHIDILFTSADELDHLMTSRSFKGLSYSREAKLLCKKVVSFFQLLADSPNAGVRRTGVTQELLTLVTGLAHYLKLLIRICLQGSLKFERESGSDEGLQKFLDTITTLDSRVAEEEGNSSSNDQSKYLHTNADICPVCSKPVEDRCFRHQDRVVHTACLKCASCSREMNFNHDEARWDSREESVLCAQCASRAGVDSDARFLAISRLQQYVHLLRVAHARLLASLRTSGALPHTSDDPNLAKYDSTPSHHDFQSNSMAPPLLSSDTRSKSYNGMSSLDDDSSMNYEQALGDIRRLRSTRMGKELSSATRRARTSRIIGGSDGVPVRPGSAGDADDQGAGQGFQIVQDREMNSEAGMPLGLTGHESMRLDDFARLATAEQAKDHRPNANKYARGGLVRDEPRPKIMSGHRRETSGAQELEKLGPEGLRPKKYFSELSALEYFIVRHVAVLSMEPLLEGHFNQEELLDLIEMRKPTFWGKFGKAFKNDKNKAGRKKGVFGVALDQLVEKDGAESTDGVGPGALRIPALIQDAVTAMRSMDMSMEGVFRKNGNIRRLKEMAETIDNKGADAVDLNSETPVQVAALLKKFLRELPDPVMTYKLHKLFLTSQKIQDEEKRRRVLHLTCCLLPKIHRDTMEVLFTFLNWTASFSVVDEESGSKMDVHNLATVVAPNILFSNDKTGGMEESFLGIEAVNALIEWNESMCEVPEDLQLILNDTSLFSNNPDITTKEILKRYADIGKANPSSNSGPQESTFSSKGSAPIVYRVEGEQVQRPWHADMTIRAPGGGVMYSSSASSSKQQLGGPGMANTPPPMFEPFYAASNQADSRDSVHVNGAGAAASSSPNRFGRWRERELQQQQQQQQQQHQQQQNGQNGGASSSGGGEVGVT